jgi:hypothetical protein
MYVEKIIGIFHKRRFESLKTIKLESFLLSNNPYLYIDRNALVFSDLVIDLVDGYLLSREETLFDDMFVALAIHVCESVYGGKKSSGEGIDLEFEKDGKYYIVSIKSGPNWGNSRQIAGMKSDFLKAKRILRTSGNKPEIVAVNGCCYGRDNNPDKGDYFKYCGQRFWEFVSGDENLYTDLIIPLGHKAKQKNEEFEKERAKIINLFTDEFNRKFSQDGEIDWKNWYDSIRQNRNEYRRKNSMTSVIIKRDIHKVTVWYSTVCSGITAIIYFLAGAGVLSAGLSENPDESPPFIFYVAGAFYAIVGYLVHIKKKWIRMSLGIINALVICIFFQMWYADPEVLTSPAGLGTKIAQLLLETGLVFLIVRTWKSNSEQ